MPDTKRILCLANSRMLGDRCIAGKELLSNTRIGGWIRLVNGREKAGLSSQERQYTDGTEPTEPCVLDIMDVPVLNAQPKDYQRENWLIYPDSSWKKIGSVTSNELVQCTDQIAPLWTPPGPIRYSKNDRVPTSIASSYDNSLRLIKVDGLELCVFPDYNRRRVQGGFRHNGADYKLWVTDFRYEQQYLEKPDDRYRIGECFLTISLTAKPFDDGYVYKLIAAVIEP